MSNLSPLAAISAAIWLTACTASDMSYQAPDYATAPLDISTPQGTAYSMMMAMYRGEPGMVDKVFHENGRVSRVKADGAVKPDGLNRWRNWVGTLEVVKPMKKFSAFRFLAKNKSTN